MGVLIGIGMGTVVEANNAPVSHPSMLYNQLLYMVIFLLPQPQSVPYTYWGVSHIHYIIYFPSLMYHSLYPIYSFTPVYCLHRLWAPQRPMKKVTS